MPVEDRLRLYREKMAAVLCLEICLAMSGFTPARIMLRTAERLKSCGVLPVSPALWQARFQTLRNSPICWPCRWKI